jgi:SAM-dependent methyltransferase
VVWSEQKSQEFDPSIPNVARMYDYFLGGKDNFAADREAAEQALSLAPEIRVAAREGRLFLHRVVQFLVDAGIRQFIDIGCGLPTQGNVHEVAQAAAPDCRVAYVDNDRVVIAHARALLENNPRTAVIQADLREPERILRDPQLRQLIDVEQPVGILLISVLHVIPDDDVAQKIVVPLRESMVPGSYLAISHAVSDMRPEVTAKLAALYQDRMAIAGPRRQNLRTKAEVQSFFDGLEMVEPGLVFTPAWRPESGRRHPQAASVWTVGGVGRKG